MEVAYDKVLYELRREAIRDHIGLWEVIRHLRRQMNVENHKIKETTLDFVRVILSHGFVAGFSRGRKFEEWPDQSADIVIRRIEQEWASLSGEPNLGDIVWFDLPVAS
jgi:hypothetical protein